MLGYFLVVLVRLSVPVQVIDWKDFVFEMTYGVLMGTLNPTHSLTHSRTPCPALLTHCLYARPHELPDPPLAGWTQERDTCVRVCGEWWRSSAGNVSWTAAAGRQQRRVHVGRRHVAAASRLQRDHPGRTPHQLPATALSQRHLAMSTVPCAGALPTPARYLLFTAILLSYRCPRQHHHHHHDILVCFLRHADLAYVLTQCLLTFFLSPYL